MRVRSCEDSCPAPGRSRLLLFSCLPCPGELTIGVGAMKHSPFESSYLQDFVILEERHVPFTRFPRSKQSPFPARAVNARFEGGLPHRIART